MREVRERKFFVDNLLVQIHYIIVLITTEPASRHVSSNPLFQVVLHLPFQPPTGVPDL